ncbi:glycosyltransferase [Agromyces sp. CFH 90414]|uniref:4,4'-diaponeurosporenoate glycosyltransferase n=1 Tax=Agromyces agglutinans TaxID=2662258 RepID=A0A6I2FEJ3_9MICO|nr:glycosyltransferase family 2 protein [Agromyces agglutinans]MRG60323.1 glycosyltransferase [Agromyces agglutinans]
MASSPARPAANEHPARAHAARPPASVSVVIPVRDDAALLRRCLASLAAQQVAPHEVIVVDDRSTDASAEVAREFGARIVNEQHIGIPAAAATGCDAATGEVIARLDADCVAPADWVRRIGERFAADPGLTGLTGTAVFVDGPPALRRPLAGAYLAAYRIVVAPALGQSPLFGSNYAVRRTAWAEVRTAVHRFDDLVHDDMDLTVHLGPERRIAFDRRLRMGMATRALRGGGVLRIRRGFHSIVMHWPREAPWFRWARRVRADLGRRRR